jgi:4-hydroxy-tetrahydrodipicolinate reductase
LSTPRRLLIVGRGRMGRLVESLSGDYGFEVAGVIDRRSAEQPDGWPAADVAIDFSTADAVPANLQRLVERRIPVVVGTTGWQAHEERLRALAHSHDAGVVAAPNFAIGVNIFLALVQRAAELASRHGQFGVWIHELHHATKRDAPSGTALALERMLRQGGLHGDVAIASTRAGSIPGTHTVGFDAAAETLTLTHEARDRSVFARGALEAARWVIGRKGWFSMQDVIQMS